MSILLPFKALRPYPEFAQNIASKPYDVVNGTEIRAEAKKNPLTFFKVTRSELEFETSENPYSEKVYQKAKQNLHQFISDKILFKEILPCYYIYSQTMQGRVQTGLVGLSSVGEYNQNKIKKHELTRPDKEQDRINHIATTEAQTGNVFLAYKNVPEIDNIVSDWQKNNDTIYSFKSEDDVHHQIWKIDNQELIKKIENLFITKVPCTYIADGHHRAASAAKVKTFKNSPEANYFLTTLFPSSQLKIMDYNRVVKDLNNHTPTQFLNLLEQNFKVEKTNQAAIPSHAQEFGMYLEGQWYLLTANKELYLNQNTIQKLNVSILQNNLLTPILNIDDPRTNQRIDFVGGIRGWQELVKKVDSKDFAVAFMIYPISIEELFEVADNGQIMPPKSTWFEPKLRDGLLTHLIS